MNNQTDSIFGDTIYAYTRAQALEDGVLVDLVANAPEVCGQHFKYPIACTAAIWDLVDRAVKNTSAHNDLNGVVHDILHMSKHGRAVDASTRMFEVIITGCGRKRNHQMKMVCGPGDQMEPVLTVMMSDED
jgi:hypothetical protein